MIDWIKTLQGIAAIVAVMFATMSPGSPASRTWGSRPSCHRFTAGSRLLEQFDRDTRLLVLGQSLVECRPHQLSQIRAGRVHRL
jgi:hypothetical protein